MTVEEITLKFPSLNKLWEFVREAKVNYSEFDAVTYTLVCNCNQSDITTAKEKFGATS